MGRDGRQGGGDGETGYGGGGRRMGGRGEEMDPPLMLMIFNSKNERITGDVIATIKLAIVNDIASFLVNVFIKFASKGKIKGHAAYKSAGTRIKITSPFPKMFIVRAISVNVPNDIYPK